MGSWDEQAGDKTYPGGKVYLWTWIHLWVHWAFGEWIFRYFRKQGYNLSSSCFNYLLPLGVSLFFATRHPLALSWVHCKQQWPCLIFFPKFLSNFFSPKLHTVLFKDCVAYIFPNVVCAVLQFWTFTCWNLKDACALSLQITRKKTLFYLIWFCNVINSDFVFKEANNYRARENIAEMVPDAF